MKVVYHKKYLNYSFGPHHPFWPERADQFVRLLKDSDITFDLVTPEKVSDEDLLLVHSQGYLEGLKKMVRDGIGYLSIDTPVTRENLEAAYYYTGGTIKACEVGVRGALAVNTLGGLHHAGISSSSGFCIFNDHAVAIRRLQKEGSIEKAAVLDLDVHAGNGTQEIFYRDPTVLTVSIHQDPTFFYPGIGFADQTGEGEGTGYNVNFPLPVGTGEDEYLKILDEALAKVGEFEPHLLVVVLGVDTYKEDPLAGFNLEKGTYFKIGQRLCYYGKFVALFAGGYSKEVPNLWLEFVKGTF